MPGQRVCFAARPRSLRDWERGWTAATVWRFSVPGVPVMIATATGRGMPLSSTTVQAMVAPPARTSTQPSSARPSPTTVAEAARYGAEPGVHHIGRLAQPLAHVVPDAPGHASSGRGGLSIVCVVWPPSAAALLGGARLDGA